jgi:hypothetical protein
MLLKQFSERRKIFWEIAKRSRQQHSEMIQARLKEGWADVID